MSPVPHITRPGPADTQTAATNTPTNADTQPPKHLPVKALRLLKPAKRSAIKSRTQAINQLKSVPASADAAMRESLAGLSNPHLLKRSTELNDSQQCGPAGTVQHVLKLLAARIHHLTGETDNLNKQIAADVEAHFPGLLDTHGIGPDSAATLFIPTSDNPDHLSTEASFAPLRGTSPVETSSGNTQQRQLNHGSNRQANTALYQIVLSHPRWNNPTQNYPQRRPTEDKTRQEITRRLKQYAAHKIYRLITPIKTTTHPAAPNRTTS